jgi:hypothetical protein
MGFFNRRTAPVKRARAATGLDDRPASRRQASNAALDKAAQIYNRIRS